MGEGIPVTLQCKEAIRVEAIEPELLRPPVGVVELVDVSHGKWLPPLAALLAEPHQPVGRDFRLLLAEAVEKVTPGVDVIRAHRVRRRVDECRLHQLTFQGVLHG